MSVPAISARLKHLTDSAHLLVSNAPGTSAYLMARCNSLMFYNELDRSEDQRSHVCGACGNIMILGWTGRRQTECLNAQKRRSNTSSKMQRSSSAKVMTIVYTCERCNRQTRQSINTNLSKPSVAVNAVHQLRAPRAANPVRGTAPLVTRSLSSSPANASSRKRAQLRRKGGLQALLAKKKETDARGSGGGSGLDLMDFMKKV